MPPSKLTSLKSKLKNIFSPSSRKKKHKAQQPAPVQQYEEPQNQDDTVWTPARLAEMKKSYREKAAQMQAEHDESERQKKEEARRREAKRKLRRTADMYDRINPPQSTGVGRGVLVDEGDGAVYSESRVRIQNGRIVRGDGHDEQDSAGRVLGGKEIQKQTGPSYSRHDDGHYSKYERETGMVDPHILRWD